jgi:hypothetical protein
MELITIIAILLAIGAVIFAIIFITHRSTQDYNKSLSNGDTGVFDGWTIICNSGSSNPTPPQIDQDKKIVIFNKLGSFKTENHEVTCD